MHSIIVSWSVRGECDTALHVNTGRISPFSGFFKFGFEFYIPFLWAFGVGAGQIAEIFGVTYGEKSTQKKSGKNYFGEHGRIVAKKLWLRGFNAVEILKIVVDDRNIFQLI